MQAPERVSHLLAVNAAHPWLRQRQLLPQLWRFWYTALLEYPGTGRLVLGHWPSVTRFLLRRGAAGPAAWQPGEIEEFVAASRAAPGPARRCTGSSSCTTSRGSSCAGTAACG
jgi:hypothetical protein